MLFDLSVINYFNYNGFFNVNIHFRPSLPRPAGQRPPSANAGPGRPPFKKKKARAALRPNNMTSRVNCSIHCAKTSGPPELSCHSCNKLFHPVCVGLMEGPDYSGFDFYCADCPPPPGTECVEMPPPLDEMMEVRSIIWHV